jgi:hypothetical protein
MAHSGFGEAGDLEAGDAIVETGQAGAPRLLSRATVQSAPVGLQIGSTVGLPRISVVLSRTEITWGGVVNWSSFVSFCLIKRSSAASLQDQAVTVLNETETVEEFSGCCFRGPESMAILPEAEGAKLRGPDRVLIGWSVVRGPWSVVFQGGSSQLFHRRVLESRCCSCVLHDFFFETGRWRWYGDNESTNNLMNPRLCTVVNDIH